MPDDTQAMLASALTRPTYAAAPPAMSGSYMTQLDPLREAAFQSWVQQNHVPFDPSPNADYDMRGFWRAMQQGDPSAQQSINQNDGQIHYPDRYKTPYHQSFSNESKWALPGAPQWNAQDQLVTPDAKIVFDERAPRRGIFGLGK